MEKLNLGCIKELSIWSNSAVSHCGEGGVVNTYGVQVLCSVCYLQGSVLAQNEAPEYQHEDIDQLTSVWREQHNTKREKGYDNSISLPIASHPIASDPHG
jgi:hypothetical protein